MVAFLFGVALAEAGCKRALVQFDAIVFEWTIRRRCSDVSPVA